MNRFRVLLLAAALAACQKSNEETPPPVSAPPAAAAATIVAFGDSLTAGRGLEDPDAESYPAVLEGLLRGRGHDVRVVNAGHSGDTTFDALERIDWALADKPAVAVVALGSNDTFQGKRLEDIEANLEAIIREFQSSGAAVVLCPLRTFPNLGPLYAKNYERLFPRVARKTGAALSTDLLEGVGGDPAMNQSDGIHPNVAGHARMARNVLPAVERALRR